MPMSKAGKSAPGGFTPAWQGVFLRVLGETGNASEAARAAGVKRGTPHNLRRRDEWFARDWEEALAGAPARIAERAPPALQTIRRSAAGRIQLAATRANQWAARDDEAFLAGLEETGNVSASARAIGRDPNSAWRRRRECPDFARRFEAALGDAEARLEYGLVEHANNLIDRAREAANLPKAESGDTMTSVDASFALQVVKWLDARKAGRGRGARSCPPKEPDIAEVKAEILRKIEAIERHRAGKRSDGETG
jgi:hypothetical protein